MSRHPFNSHPFKLGRVLDGCPHKYVLSTVYVHSLPMYHHTKYLLRYISMYPPHPFNIRSTPVQTGLDGCIPVQHSFIMIWKGPIPVLQSFIKNGRIHNPAGWLSPAESVRYYLWSSHHLSVPTSFLSLPTMRLMIFLAVKTPTQSFWGDVAFK